MLNFYEFTEETPHGIAFRDLMTMIGFIFIVLFVITLIHINPKAENQNATSIPVGNVNIFTFWPDSLDIDIDTWVYVNGEERPIGYSNQHGHFLDLLKDDLGHTHDASKRNFELVASRGIVPGKWIVNLHYYKKYPDTPNKNAVNIPVQVIVEVNKNKDEKILILDKTVFLVREGSELTVASFMLTEEGRLIKGSIDDRFITLRSGEAYRER